MSDRTAAEIVEREYLELRARVLELAASLDRIDRAEGQGDDRMAKIQQGIHILLDGQDDKAKRVQQLFSREYASGWRDEFGI